MHILGSQLLIDEGTPVGDLVTLDDQVEASAEFLEGLLDAFGLEGEVDAVEIEEDVVEVRLIGSDDLAILIGPRGQTLSAIQELNRAVLQRQFRGRREGRLFLDIAGYRERRREALGRFATRIAEEVLEAQESQALEPMNSADRKVVHDTINGIDGVHTQSEGEDARRHVVILLDDEDAD